MMKLLITTEKINHKVCLMKKVIFNFFAFLCVLLNVTYFDVFAFRLDDVVSAIITYIIILIMIYFHKYIDIRMSRHWYLNLFICVAELIIIWMFFNLFSEMDYVSNIPKYLLYAFPLVLLVGYSKSK